MRAIASVLAALLLAACSGDDDTHPRDAGGDAERTDAGLDAAQPDARPTDAALDAPPPDAAPFDATPPADAAARDAGPADGGPCPPGFHRDGLLCADVDECADGTAACDARPCRNTEGAYTCGCDPGLFWDAAACARAGVHTIAAGGMHGCDVGADGSLRCWGNGLYGQLGVDPAVEPRRARRAAASTDLDWASVAAGGVVETGISCALRGDASLWCWGIYLTPFDPIRTAPAAVGSAAWSEIVVGAGHLCGIQTDRTLWCWGADDFGQVGDGGGATFPPSRTPVHVGAGTDWAMVAASDWHTCAVATDGSMWCWGFNGMGELGMGGGDASAPVRVGTDHDWTAVATGRQHSCGLRADGTRWCWGRNDQGQLGNGALIGTPTPVRADARTDWVRIAAGGNYGCALRADASLWCWGELAAHDEPSADPRRIDGTWGDVVVSGNVGGGFACGVRSDGTLACWGRNGQGQLAAGTFGDQEAPVPVGTARWRALGARTDDTTCAIRDDGTLWCWGATNRGEIGLGSDRGAYATPQHIGTVDGWRSYAGDSRHQCAVRDDGTLWCWGLDEHGDTGLGGLLHESPERVGAGTDWQSVSAGGIRTCGVRTPGTLWCWGASALGDGVDRLAPEQLGSDADWLSIGIAGSPQCGRRAPGALWCGLPPMQLATDADWTALAAGAATCGIRAPGTLWCWGTTVLSGDAGSTPVQVGSADDWIAIAPPSISLPTLRQIRCGLRAGGTLWCWGAQLAAAARRSRVLDFDPVRIGTDTGWTEVVTQDQHACALRDDGTLWCWGVQDWGQLGTGDAWSDTPLAALPPP